MDTSLNGIRVLEMGHYVAAPYCSQILADLGADVLKIERPGGDASRQTGPFVKDVSLNHASFNRNKKAMTLNLKDERGKEIFRKLLADCDVFLENQRPGLLEKNGFSDDEILSINPRLVIAHVSGYGSNGPYRDRVAFDMTIQAVSGIMSVTGMPDNPPTRVGFAVTDVAAALFTTIGILAALRFSESTGKGQVLDISMMDSAFALLEDLPTDTLMSDFVPKRNGNTRPVTGPCNSYPCKEGYVYIAASSDVQFESVMKIVGHPEVIGDTLFSDTLKRKQNQEPLDRLIEEWTKTKDAEEVVEILSKNKVPSAVVKDIPNLLTDPQLLARNMIVSLPHPVLGTIRMTGNPIDLSVTPVVYRTAGPSVGQDTEEVLQHYGYSVDEIATLKANTVI